MSGGEAIWCKCESWLVAGELLDVCTCTLSTRLAIGKMHWVQLSKICVSKKDQPSENCVKGPTT